jgi:hypothetical protein
MQGGEASITFFKVTRSAYLFTTFNVSNPIRLARGACIGSPSRCVYLSFAHYMKTAKGCKERSPC